MCCLVHTNPRLFGSYHHIPQPQIKIQHIVVSPLQGRMSVPGRLDRSRTKTTRTLRSSILLMSNLTMEGIRQRMGKSYVRIPEEMLVLFSQRSKSCRCHLIRFGKLLPVRPKRLNGCVVMRSRIPNRRIQ